MADCDAIDTTGLPRAFELSRPHCSFGIEAVGLRDVMRKPRSPCCSSVWLRTVCCRPGRERLRLRPEFFWIEEKL
jgi:hypothetical protein